MGRKKMTAKISDPKEIGILSIKNRFVRSATYERLATDDGYVTDELVDFYKILASGGVGLVITGLAYIQPNAQAMPYQIGIDKDKKIPNLRKMTDAVHKFGNNSKIMIQLAHSGRQSFFLDEMVAPSAVIEPLVNNTPREMTIEEVEETIEAFAQAARRAKEAGFDGVQMHAAHGFLLSEFLSPYTNRRTDEYGGNLENRMKIVEKIYNRTVEIVGKDFPIIIKMNVDDFLEGGIDLTESKKIAERLSNIGYNAIETSGCMWEVTLRSKEELGWTPAFNPESRVDIDSKDKEAYFLPYAREIKKLIDVPLILVGGIRSLDVVVKILAEGSADFISLSRPLIRDPDLPNKWLNGIGEPKSDCISCNGCTGSIMSGSLRCIKK